MTVLDFTLLGILVSWVQEDAIYACLFLSYLYARLMPGFAFHQQCLNGPFDRQQISKSSSFARKPCALLLLLQGSAHSNLSFAGMRLRDIIGWSYHLGCPLTMCVTWNLIHPLHQKSLDCGPVSVGISPHLLLSMPSCFRVCRQVAASGRVVEVTVPNPARLSQGQTFAQQVTKIAIPSYHAPLWLCCITC